jgi:hypothetical protein
MRPLPIMQKKIGYLITCMYKDNESLFSCLDLEMVFRLVEC